jgi:hypothetical protein
MFTYRLFFLDDQSKVRSSLVIECADDAEALAWAKAQPRRQAAELWQGERVMARFEAEA